jgi:hypothetical protein
MRSRYLGRITDICADIATKLTAETSRGDAASAQTRAVSRHTNNSSFLDDFRSSRRPRDLRDDEGRDIPVGTSFHDEREWAIMDECDDAPRFAAFVADLDSLRQRMLGVSFCDRVRSMSREIAGAAESGGDAQLTPASDAGQALTSVCDAITSAVLLLPYHSASARRGR